MAKVGFWLKGANGKLAGATVYQSNGETIMREVVKPTYQDLSRLVYAMSWVESMAVPSTKTLRLEWDMV